MMNIEIKGRPARDVFGYFAIAVGFFIVALGLNLFLIPNRLAAGGASGLATILFYTSGLPVGPTIAAINVVLFVAGVMVFGKTFGVKTIYGALGLSFAVYITKGVPNVTTDPFLATLYGGILTGIGMGVVFYNGANTGGTDILAQILSKYSNLAIGQLFLVVDMAVTLLAWSVFGAKLALYGLIAVIIMGRVIDLVLEGVTYEKAAFIISEKAQDIANNIFDELGRGVTFLESRGGYTKRESFTLLCVVSKRQLESLKDIVSRTDKNAFTIITDAREVRGEGFRTF